MNKKLNITLITIASVLRLLFIWRAPLWYDENFNWLLSRLPLKNMLVATGADVHPPLHYLTIWPLGQIPNAPAWIIRLPSALFSILALIVFWRILQDTVSNPTVRMGALILMAIAPVQIYYAQEGRMYALLELTILCCFWALLSPRTRWVVLALSLVAMLYTQNYALFYIPCLLVAWVFRRPDYRKEIFFVLQVVFLAFLAWLPWAMIMVGQMNGIHGTHWIPVPSLEDSMAILFRFLFMAPGLATSKMLEAVVFYGWLTFAILWCLRQKISARWMGMMLILAFGPFLLALMASWLWQPILLDRPLIGSSPWLYILLVSPTEWVLQKRIRWLFAAMLIAPPLIANLASIYLYGAIEKVAEAKTLTVLKTIEQNWKPGDIIYHQSDTSWVDMTSYATHPEDHYRMVPCGVISGGLTPITRTAMGMQVSPLSDLELQRAWVISVETPLDPPCEAAYLKGFIQNIQPMICYTDDKGGDSCVYLVKKQP